MAIALSQDAGRLATLASLPDRDLVVRCREGDHSAFRLVVERYGDALFGTALLMTNDRALAEDLTQEAFVRAWRGLGGFRLGSPLKPWLIRIVVNGVVSHRRRRLLDLVPLPWAERVPAEDRTPERAMIVHEERDAVRGALALLSLSERRLIYLRYCSELSVPEIAQATGLRQGTVKSRLHRALARLSALLTEAERSTAS